MILDNTLVLAEKQAITAATTLASTHVHDTKAAANVGIGEPMYFVAQVAVTLAGGTDVQAVLQTSDDNSAWTTVQSGPVVATANLKAGRVLAAHRQPIGLKRYIRAAFTSTGTFTAGSVTAFICQDIDAQQYLKAV